MSIVRLKNLIQDVPNFPKKGIIFRDISPLLADSQGINLVVKHMASKIASYSQKPTIISGPESRGFIFGVALAMYLSLGFVPIRKPGKLPRPVYRCKYDLEYSSDTLEVHQDAFKKDDKVILIDDLLATGGTARACLHVIKESQAEVIGLVFLLELRSLLGREKLSDFKVNSLIKYE